MKKSIIIACSMLLAVSCNLLDKDDDNDDPPVPPGAADVAVAELDAPDSVMTGAVASITATIENTSSEAVSETFMVILTNQSSDINLDTVEVEGIAANASTEVTLEWNTANATAGENTIAVSHTYNDDNADNDEATATVEVVAGDGSLLDIGITEVTAPDTASLGSMVDVEVTLENLGDSSVTDDITLTLTDNATSEVLGSEVISGSESGAQSMVTFTWNTEGLTAGDYTLTVSHDYMDDNATNDSVDVVINLTEEEVSSAVDLAITDITAPETVTVGDDATIEVVISNAGEEAVSDDITVTLTDDAGNELGSEVINGVGAATDANVSFTWATDGVAAGEYTLTVAFDYADGDESNNEDTVTITVEEAGEASINTDLDIVTVETPENTVTDGVIYVTQGDTVFVEVTVENSGPNDIADDIPVVIYHHGNNEGSATITGGLTSGESATVEILWLTQNQGTGGNAHPLDVTIDIADTDDSNNVVTINAYVAEPDS